MKKYQVLEKFMIENKDKWFNAKELQTVIKINPQHIKLIAKIGFMHIKKVNEPRSTNYYKYNQSGGKWGLVTKLIKNGNKK